MDFQGDSKVIAVRLQQLQRDFKILIMKNEESIDIFLSRAEEIISKIRSCDEKITYQTILEKIPRNMTS